MKILSLFDGISCARTALKKSRRKITVYYASEIDKPAIEVAQKNYPDTVQLGDIHFLDEKFDLNKKFGNGIDLLIGGSPCQDLSIAKIGRKGLNGERSSLFFEYVRVLESIKPKYFILENVASMPKEAKDMISGMLGVQPIMIDAALVSAQNRRRLFWTNIPNVVLPKDREIFLKDILQPEEEVDEKYYVSEETLKTIFEKMRQGKPLAQAFRIRGTDGKSVTLQAQGGGTGAKTGLYVINPNGTEKLKANTLRTSGRGSGFGDKHNWDEILVVPEATKKGFAIAKDGDSVDLSYPTSKTRRGRVGEKAKNLVTHSTINVFKNGRVRKLTPIECERLQGLPDEYTGGGFRQSALQDARERFQCGRHHSYSLLPA